jgi:glycosyltransferase involved in cell wall biosynthesis
MRICLLGDAQSIHLQQLAAGLARRGHEVRVATHKPAEIPGVEVERFRVPEASVTNLRGWDGRRTQYLRGFLRRFDVVNIQFLADWGFRFDPPLIENAALVATAWGSDIVDPPGETPANAELIEYRRTLLRRADAVTACGPTFAAMVAGYAGTDAGHVDVVPFGVDLTRFRRRMPSQRNRRKSPRVGFLKGFRAVYGPTVLMKAIPLVIGELPEAQFDLVGEGAELVRCQAMASELHIEHAIRWVPRQKHEGLPALLETWDLTVIPSVHEAFGVAALESSAMGVPVVASDVDGLVDTVLHGETGLRVPPGDPTALANAIAGLLKDRKLRTQMGESGRAMVEREYDMELVLELWLRFYERVRENNVVMV